MAMAVQRLHKSAQVTIGPWIDRGFYYDFDLAEPLSDKELKVGAVQQRAAMGV
jgi:threonyl-tRNA synthetase